MPRAAYIVFAQMGVVDATTNGISLFNVIEGFEGQKVDDKTPSEPLPEGSGLAAFLVAVWKKEAEDTPDISFETDIICYTPSGEPLFVGAPTTFSFPSHINFH